MLIAALYFFPWVIVILIAAPKLLELLRLFKKTDTADKKTDAINDLKKKFEKSSKFNTPITDLMKIKPIIISQIWLIIKIVSFFYMLPIAMLRMSLMLRWGSKISWQLPVSFYEIWQVLFLVLSYYYSYKQTPIAGIVIAVVVGTSSFYYIISVLERGETGTLKILNRPLHKLNFRDLIEAGLMIIISFAAVFYSFSNLYPNTFSSKLTILDSLYFSLITASTVGYGDIRPVSNLAKLLIMSEILFGLLYILFIISAFLSVFIKRQSEGQEKQEVK
jgi:hypothetical protein